VFAIYLEQCMPIFPLKHITDFILDHSIIWLSQAFMWLSLFRQLKLLTEN